MNTELPPNTNEIQMYLHCRKCIEEDLRTKIGVGWTVLGIQVWCENHDCNMMHMDFQGHKHPANQSRKKDADTDTDSG